MKRLYCHFCLLLILGGNLCLISTAQAQVDIQWEPMNEGLEGDQVDVLWRSPAGTFFAGGGVSGLFRSEGLGERWQPTTLTEGYVGVMTADSSGRIIAGTNVGVYVSEDEGLSWSPTTVKIPVYSLAVLPNGDVFAGAIDGVYRRKHGEAIWMLSGQWDQGGTCLGGDNFDLTYTPICAMAVLGDSTLLVGVEGSLFMTRDGDRWDCFNAVLEEICVTFVRPLHGTEAVIEHLKDVESGFMVELGETCSVLRYDSSRRQFEETGLSGRIYNFAEIEKAILVAMEGASGASCSFRGGLYSSQDDGREWTPISTTEPFLLNVLAAKDLSWLCSGTGGGVYCSIDGGSTWKAWNEGLSNAEVTALYFSHKKWLFAGAAGGARMDLSQAIPEWLSIRLPTEYSCFITPSAFAENTSDIIFASRGARIDVYRSYDQGKTWEMPRNRITHGRQWPAEDSRIRKVIPCASGGLSDIYYDTSCPTSKRRQSVMLSRAGEYVYYLLFRSKDNFDTIESVEIDYEWPVGEAIGNQSSVALARDSSIILASWKAIFRFNENEGAKKASLVYLGNDIIQDLTTSSGGVLLAVTNHGVLRSTDHGMSWTDSSPKSACFNTIKAGPDGIVIVDGKYLSRDEGLTWDLITNPLPGQILSMTFDAEGRLYVGTQGWGVYRSVEAVSVGSTSDKATSKFMVEAFPVPTSSEVNIRINLPEPRDVAVEFFDMLGRKKLILPVRHYSGGQYMITPDVSALAKGFYLVRILAGDESKILTVLLFNP